MGNHYHQPTDAVTLHSQSHATQLLVSAAAEDTQDPREDGPVVSQRLRTLTTWSSPVLPSSVAPSSWARVAGSQKKRRQS